MLSDFASATWALAQGLEAGLLVLFALGVALALGVVVSIEHIAGRVLLWRRHAPFLMRCARWWRDASPEARERMARRIGWRGYRPQGGSDGQEKG